MPGPRQAKPRHPRADAVLNRQALLDAGMAAFARSGFERANVRTICAAAGVNIGAINRHFGGKQNLYREILLRAGRALVDHEPCPRLEDFAIPADALRGWMHFMLKLILLRKAKDAVIGGLLMEEVRRPTPVMDELIEFLLAPIHAELVRIVDALMGDRSTPTDAVAAAGYVLGLCGFQELGEPVLVRLGHRSPRSEEEIAQLLDTLFPFAHAGVVALAACRSMRSV